ncbi:Sodium/proton antiporter [candidate division SR1 bacterium RAAC1_SR1_1]|nr:Sodium/proton antiporter [candidate division SR1 bacterium RAAC1_SR1_1]
MNKHILNTNSLKTIGVSLLVINLILAVYIAFFKRDALWVETLKAGGSENFAMIEKLYTSESFKSQQAQTLAQVLGSMEGGAATSETTDGATTGTTLDQATMDAILKDTLIKGNKDARFVIFEYSDILCPFCKRHHNDQTLQKVAEKYPNDVALIFKNMPLVQLHPTAFKGAEAIECAGKVGGSDAFYKYLDKAFLQESFDDNNVLALAKEIGLNSSKFTSCVNNQEFKSKIDGILEEARTIFGINGTPGNVILDKQTGKYVIINGAYPFEKFDTEIQNLMK